MRRPIWGTYKLWDRVVAAAWLLMLVSTVAFFSGNETARDVAGMFGLPASVGLMILAWAAV